MRLDTMTLRTSRRVLLLLLGLTLLLGLAESGFPADAAATSPAVSFVTNETTSEALHAVGERDGPPDTRHDADEETNAVAVLPADADPRASERSGRNPPTRAVVRALLGTRGRRRLGGRRLGAANCPPTTYAVKVDMCTKKPCSASVVATISVPVFKGFSVTYTNSYVYQCPCYTAACPTCLCAPTSSCSGDCPNVCVSNGYNCVTCSAGTFMPYSYHTASQCLACPKGHYCPTGSRIPLPW